VPPKGAAVQGRAGEYLCTRRPGFAAVIPVVAIPVSLIGTFTVPLMIGY
jgi:hypothetical protein